MFSKCVFMFLLIESRYIYGQVSNTFFRKDYNYIDETSSFYKVHTLPKTWEGAKAKCDSEGAILFYPEDEDEALAVITHWNQTQPLFHWIFIGIAAWNVKEVFETVDGRPVSAVYDNWGLGEPNNADGNESCVILRRDATLNDDNCLNQYPFICKKHLATLLWNTQCNLPDPNYEYSKVLDRCYKFHETPKNWSDAYAICHAEESYLAVINSQDERSFLVDITERAPKDNVVGDYLPGAVHLGFQNRDGWVTVKDVPLHKSGYSGWAPGQPDGAGSETCGSMFYNGQLNDIGCSQKMFFICEHEVQLRTEDINYKFGSNDDLIKKVFNFSQL